MKLKRTLNSSQKNHSEVEMKMKILAKTSISPAMSHWPILPIEQVVTAFYLRLRVSDEPGVLSKITTILADHGISIDALPNQPQPTQRP